MMSMNANNTIFHAAELMVYFEKHKILKIIARLFAEIAYDRPECAKKWICENIHRIANGICTMTVCIQIPAEAYEIEKFTQMMWEQCKTPVLMYTRRDPCESIDFVLNNLQKYLHHKGLEKKTKILLNFQNDIQDVKEFQNSDITPTSALMVQKPNACRHDTTTFSTFTKFYSDCVERISPEFDEISKEPNYEDLVERLFHVLKNQIPRDPSTKLRGAFTYRIVVCGRRGSGRKRQSAALAVRFNLVYIDVEQLIYQTLKSNDTMSNVLQVAFVKPTPEITSTALASLVWKRLLQPDALRSGWVLTNGFPNTASEFRLFMEQFTVPPNKIVYLHCSQCTATKRLFKKWGQRPTRLPRNSAFFVEKEMEYYRSHKSEILAYLKTRPETIHIDARDNFETVRKEIWSPLEKQQTKSGCVKEEIVETFSCEDRDCCKC